MFQKIIDFLNYPLIGSIKTTEVVNENGETVLETTGFELSFLNLLIFIVIYLSAKAFIKYIKRYFRALQLTEKQLKIEGKEIAVWKLAKQIIYLFSFYIGFLTLSINNPNLNTSDILAYEFFKFKSIHFAVYHLFLVAGVIFMARILLNFLKIYLLKAVRKNDNIDSGTEYVYLQLAKYFVYSTTTIILLRSFGIDLDLFLTGSAFLLVGFGLGLQHIFKDYFSGILLLFEGTVKVDDVIEIERLNGEENFIAKVVQINLRTSKVETRDEKILIIPNSKLTHESVINWSLGSEVTRFTIPITFHFGTDTELIQDILVKCAMEHDAVVKTKKPFVRLLKFGNSGLEMDLVFWADKTLLIEVLKSDIRYSMDKALRKHKIKIPYQQTDVHFPADFMSETGKESDRLH